MADLQDAYLFAIHNEIKSQNLYSLLAIAFEDTDAKARFQGLEKMERVHEEKVTELFHRRFPGVELKVDREVLPRLRESEQLDDPRHVLEFAISREVEARDGYRDLVEQEDNPEIREIFQQLSAEEENHIVLLEDEIHRLQGSLLWFDESELGGLMEY